MTAIVIAARVARATLPLFVLTLLAHEVTSQARREPPAARIQPIVASAPVTYLSVQDPTTGQWRSGGAYTSLSGNVVLENTNGEFGLFTYTCAIEPCSEPQVYVDYGVDLLGDTRYITGAVFQYAGTGEAGAETDMWFGIHVGADINGWGTPVSTTETVPYAGEAPGVGKVYNWTWDLNATPIDLAGSNKLGWSYCSTLQASAGPVIVTPAPDLQDQIPDQFSAYTTSGTKLYELWYGGYSPDNGIPYGSHWVIIYGVPDPWTDLGYALAGVAGEPVLAGTGPLTGGSPMSLSLTSAAPNAQAILLISLTSIPHDFKGGTLVPLPALLQVILFTDPTGSITLSAPWPTFPTGTEVYFQAAIQDAAATKGMALSNAVHALVP